MATNESTSSLKNDLKIRLYLIFFIKKNNMKSIDIHFIRYWLVNIFQNK